MLKNLIQQDTDWNENVPKKATMGVSEHWRMEMYNCANSLPSNTISIYSRMTELHSELNLKI